jgi:hypothetical protein
MMRPVKQEARKPGKLLQLRRSAVVTGEDAVLAAIAIEDAVYNRKLRLPDSVL